MMVFVVVMVGIAVFFAVYAWLRPRDLPVGRSLSSVLSAHSDSSD